MNILANAALLSLACLLFCAVGLKRTAARPYVLWSALFVLLDTTATDLWRVVHWIPRIPGTYNWTGKFSELLVCLITIAILTGVAGWKREELGLTTAFRPGTGKDVLRYLVPVLAVETAALWFPVPAQTLTWEDHLFQLTAPGLTEELAFRGILLALLDRAFSGRKLILGAPLGWSAVVSALLFGLWHGLDVNRHLQVSLDVAPMVIPLLGGLVLAWCRARSGSLLLPFIAHAGMNEAANLIGLAKPRS